MQCRSGQVRVSATSGPENFKILLLILSGLLVWELGKRLNLCLEQSLLSVSRRNLAVYVDCFLLMCL